MRHSIVQRAALVDLELLKIPAPVLINRPASQIERQVLALAANPALPDAVTNGPKSGVFLPMDRWSRQSCLLAKWPASRSLQSSRLPSAGRLVFSLVAQIHPEVMIRL